MLRSSTSYGEARDPESFVVGILIIFAVVHTDPLDSNSEADSHENESKTTLGIILTLGFQARSAPRLY